MENINLKARDLRIETTENGFLVLERSNRDPYTEGEVGKRYVFEDMDSLFAFLESHFVLELPDTKTDPRRIPAKDNPWAVDGPIYGGGS